MTEWQAITATLRNGFGMLRMPARSHVERRRCARRAIAGGSRHLRLAHEAQHQPQGERTNPSQNDGLRPVGKKSKLASWCSTGKSDNKRKRPSASASKRFWINCRQRTPRISISRNAKSCFSTSTIRTPTQNEMPIRRRSSQERCRMTSAPIRKSQDSPEKSTPIGGDARGESIVCESFGSVRGSGDRPGLQILCGV